MSYARKGILGATAILLSFGAAQFAAGENLTVGMRSAGIMDEGVNRATKTDRGAVFSEPVAPTQTISIHVDRVPETSVLVRVPLNKEARGGAVPANQPKPGEQLKSGERKMTVACES